MALLLADPDGRDYEFLRPVDLGATWESYQSPPSGTEREAESGTLAGGASVFSNSNASGGQIVGALLPGQVPSRSASIPSSRTVQVRYSSGSSVQGKVSLYSGSADVGADHVAAYRQLGHLLDRDGERVGERHGEATDRCG